MRLTGTHNHPVLCLRDVAGVPVLLWTLLEEVEPGDHVVLSRNTGPEQASEDPEYDRKLGVLAGAFVSEGWASEKRAGFNNVDPEYFEEALAAYDDIVGGARYVYERDSQVRTAHSRARRARHRRVAREPACRACRVQERGTACAGVRLAGFDVAQAVLFAQPLRGRWFRVAGAAPLRPDHLLDQEPGACGRPPDAPPRVRGGREAGTVRARGDQALHHEPPRRQALRRRCRLPRCQTGEAARGARYGTREEPGDVL